MKILEWNIRGAASMGWNNEYKIEAFVVKKLMKEQADIFILLEFVVAKGWDDFQLSLEKHNYVWFMTYTSSQNGVLIAVRKDIQGLNIESIEKYKENIVTTELNSAKTVTPNFLQVKLEINKQEVFVIGVRIRCCDYVSQFSALKDHFDSLSKECKILCVGDFNEWHKFVLKKIGESYKVYTPIFTMQQGRFETLDVWSAVPKNKEGKCGKALLDHIVTKGIEITNLKYDGWGFVNQENGYGDLQPESYKNLIGRPDHDILTAEFKVND